MNYIFGVDGGGTGCRVGLADKDGNILSRVEGGPANIETSLTTAENNIVTTCKKALVQAGLKESILKESFAVLGLAGSNMGDFDKDLSVRLPFKKNTIIKKEFKGTRIQIQKKCVNFILKYLEKLI